MRFLGRKGFSVSSVLSRNNLALQTAVLVSRNLEGFPFPNSANPIWQEDVKTQSKLFFQKRLLRKGFQLIELGGETETVAQNKNIPRFVLSRFLSEPAGKLLIFKNNWGILVNHQDHFKIFGEGRSLGLMQLWSGVKKIDNWLEQEFTYAFDQRFGYLTASPFYTGTGMVVLIRLHLPAISLLYGVEQVSQWLKEKEEFLLTGVNGEREIIGHVFELSNRYTLGVSESQTLQTMKKMVTYIVEWEKQVRQSLVQSPLRQNGLLEKIAQMNEEFSHDFELDLRKKDFFNFLSLWILAYQEGIFSGKKGFDKLKLKTIVDWSKIDSSLRKEYVGLEDLWEEWLGRIVSDV
ncbi:MAG: protein arginine kinase [Candidatus Atribacteria bacterium]|nr:protein arginine kinase [Candidatus Atribacteria bacterium]